MNKMELDIELLKYLYLQQEKAMHEVAKIMGCSVGKVYNTLTENNIPKRKKYKGMKGKHHTQEARNKISNGHKGKIYSAETRQKLALSKTKGGIGHKKKREDGYIAIYFPDHPCSNKDGYIMEHILVMEALLGRHLEENECIHHINHKRDDNRKENLMLMTVSTHMSLHSTERWNKWRKENAQ